VGQEYHSDVGTSATVNVTLSKNTQGIDELSGESVSTGMDVDLGFTSPVSPSAGTSQNYPKNGAPSSTTVSAGISSSVSPVDVHITESNTTVNNNTSQSDNQPLPQPEVN
jgi:hypothetical protein